eukprot:Clim_evm65s156 gene=Clim_evmTU65s156
MSALRMLTRLRPLGALRPVVRNQTIFARHAYRILSQPMLMTPAVTARLRPLQYQRWTPQQFAYSTGSEDWQDFFDRDDNLHIDIETVEKLIKSKGAEVDFHFIDVREPDEFAAGAIPKAENVPLGDVVDLNAADLKKKYTEQLHGQLEKDDNIVVYCRSGKRSEKARLALVDKGFVNVKNFTGSWLAWSERHPQ